MDVLQLELGDFDSVRAFAKEFADLNTNRLDILILNAGVMLGRPMGAGAEDAHFQLTKSGFEVFKNTPLRLDSLCSRPVGFNVN